MKCLFRFTNEQAEAQLLQIQLVLDKWLKFVWQLFSFLEKNKKLYNKE